MNEYQPLSNEILLRNQASLKRLCDGEHNVIVKAEWNDSGNPAPIQPVLMENAELDLQRSAAYCEVLTQAAQSGLDNIPFARVDCGRIAYLIALAYGCEPVPKGTVVSARPLAKTAAEAALIKKPLHIEQCGLYPEILARMREFERRMGPVAFLPADTQSPFDVLTELIHMEDALLMLYDEPEVLHAVLQRITESIQEITEIQRQAVTNWGFGNDYPISRGIHLSDDNAAFISPVVYREFCQPYVEQLSDHFHGVTLHCCMRYQQNIEVMSKTRGLMGMDPQPRFHESHEVLPYFGQVPFWRIFWIPDTEHPLAYYQSLIDQTEDICGLMIEVNGENRDDTLRLAHAVKEYAVRRGRD